MKTEQSKPHSEMGLSVTCIGGAKDGEEFRLVEATMSDGTKRAMFISNARPGFFKQVFVPWDFEHPDIV